TNDGGLTLWTQDDLPKLLDDRPSAHAAGITALTFRPAGASGRHQLLSASMDRTAALWSLPGQSIRTISGTFGRGLSVRDKKLISAGDDGSLGVWAVDDLEHAAAGSVVPRFLKKGGGTVALTALALKSDGKLAAAADTAKVVRIFPTDDTTATPLTKLTPG